MPRNSRRRAWTPPIPRCIASPALILTSEGRPPLPVRAAEPLPGEAAEIDFCLLGLLFDPERGRRRHDLGVLVTLCYSLTRPPDHPLPGERKSLTVNDLNAPPRAVPPRVPPALQAPPPHAGFPLGAQQGK
jgi:hypothetical protein